MACCVCCWAAFVLGLLFLVRWLLGRLKLGKFSEKPVFITGCDTGFGHLLALKLLRSGLPVFAGCLTEKGETELRKEAGSFSGNLVTVPLNVADQNSVDKAVQLVKDKLGGKGLWGVVNNAGIVGNSSMDDFLVAEDYQKALDVNTLGVIRVTQGFKELVKKSRGRIVTVTSILGRLPQPGAGPYVVSKHAAEGYCDVLRQELRNWGVSVHILEPGFFATNITNKDVVKRNFEMIWNRAPKHVQIAYGEEFRKKAMESLTEWLPKFCSPRTDFVVDAYFHALTSWWPQKRYHVGYDSMFLWIPLSVMPTCVQDCFYKVLDWYVSAPVPQAALS